MSWFKHHLTKSFRTQRADGRPTSRDGAEQGEALVARFENYPSLLQKVKKTKSVKRQLSILDYFRVVNFHLIGRAIMKMFFFLEKATQSGLKSVLFNF